MFHQLVEQLRGTIAAEWAAGIRFHQVDVGAYERLFAQAGFPFPDELRRELEANGAFDVPLAGNDEARDAIADQRGFGAALLGNGLHLLTPRELFETYVGQRAGASADSRLGSLWVFAAPHRYLWTDAFALDAAGGVRPFHEDDIHEALALGRTPSSFEKWERVLTSKTVDVVKALTEEGLEPFAAQVHERKPFNLAEYVGKPWNQWVDRIWRQALRTGPLDVARAVISDVGTLVTKPSEAHYRLPSALDVMHRIPLENRRDAVLAMWGRSRPTNSTVLAAMEAPSLLATLAPIAWPHRGPADSDDVRWARAVSWLIGDAEPAQMIEAASFGVHTRDVNETLWLRLEPFARELGVL